MTQEQIEKGFDYYMRTNVHDNYREYFHEETLENMKTDFASGIEWFVKSVWHKAEKPDEDKPCLVEYKDPDNGKTRYKVSVYCGYEWKELTHYEHDCNIRWAYVEDLLPTKDE